MALYNAVIRAREQHKGGRSDAQVLVDQLKEGGIPHEVYQTMSVKPVSHTKLKVIVQVLTRVDEAGNDVFQAVIWAHPHEIECFKRYPDVIGIDCTGRFIKSLKYAIFQ